MNTTTERLNKREILRDLERRWSKIQRELKGMPKYGPRYEAKVKKLQGLQIRWAGVMKTMH